MRGEFGAESGSKTPGGEMRRAKQLAGMDNEGSTTRVAQTGEPRDGLAYWPTSRLKWDEMPRDFEICIGAKGKGVRPR